MDESTKRYMSEIASSIGGGILIGITIMIGLEAWGTMNLIEAQGLLGQTLNESQYRDALFRLQLSTLGFFFGWILVINAAVEDLKKTLYKINGN